MTLQGEGVTTQILVEHCCHCGGIIGATEELLYARVRGERGFGWCPRCNALHHSRCVACVPQEQRCENVEAGRSPTDNGTAVTLYLPTSFPGK